MIATDFRELVEELEDSTRDSDSGYRTRVALLAALGYAYVVAVIVLLVASLWLILGVVKDGRHLALLKLAIPMAALALVGARALWVRLEPPEGLELTEAQAPKLFSMLRKIRRGLKGPPIHRVVIDDEFNAAIMQLPRFGLFGGSRNHLIIGLPLMQALSVEQFAAVLAHEYGHLSGAHGQFSAWIYRVRATWSRILDALIERPVWGGGIFLRFFRWYVPYFQAYTFVLARSNEYEADRASADIVGERTAADALVQVELAARFFSEEFWPRYASGADKAPRPASLPYAQLPTTFSVGMDPARAQGWLAAAMRVETGLDDTHPSLKDRLEAIGQGARVPEKSANNAARALLGAHLAEVTKAMDQAWARANLKAWSERHRESTQLKERAAVIAAKAKGGEALNGEEWYEFARACERHASPDKALAYYRRAVEAAPEYAEAHLAIGMMLLKSRDDAGLAHLDKATAGGGDIRWTACAAAASYLREAGRTRDAERYELKMQAQHAQESESEAHRVFLMPDDVFAPHGLGPKELALCRATFRRLPRVYKAHAVRKMLPGGAESQLVFVIEPRVSLVTVLWTGVLSYVGMTPKEDPLADDVLDKLRLEQPFTVFLDLYLEDEIEQKVAAVEGSLIFDGNDRQARS